MGTVSHDPRCERGRRLLCSCLVVWHAHAYLVVKSACSPQSGIKGVGPVGSANDNDGFPVRLIPRHIY